MKKKQWLSWLEVNLAQTLIVKVSKRRYVILVRKKLEKLIFSLIEECEALTFENCMLKSTCSDLKKDVNRLERKR